MSKENSETARQALTPNQQKTIAIVDDDPEMRSSLTTLLNKVGYHAESYDSAETFLTCTSTCKASCVVIDVDLGDISGVELAHQLFADGLKWPIIFITGLDTAAISSKASAVSPIAFLRKPFPEKELIGAIEKAIQWSLVMQAIESPFFDSQGEQL